MVTFSFFDCRIRVTLLRTSDIIFRRIVLYFDRKPACNRSLFPGRKSHDVNLYARVIINVILGTTQHNLNRTSAYKSRREKPSSSVAWVPRHTTQISWSNVSIRNESVSLFAE